MLTKEEALTRLETDEVVSPADKLSTGIIEENL